MYSFLRLTCTHVQIYVIVLKYNYNKSWLNKKLNLNQYTIINLKRISCFVFAPNVSLPGTCTMYYSTHQNWQVLTGRESPEPPPDRIRTKWYFWIIINIIKLIIRTVFRIVRNSHYTVDHYSYKNWWVFFVIYRCWIVEVCT